MIFKVISCFHCITTGTEDEINLILPRGSVPEYAFGVLFCRCLFTVSDNGLGIAEVADC